MSGAHLSFSFLVQNPEKPFVFVPLIIAFSLREISSRLPVFCHRLNAKNVIVQSCLTKKTVPRSNWLRLALARLSVVESTFAVARATSKAPRPPASRRSGMPKATD